MKALINCCLLIFLSFAGCQTKEKSTDAVFLIDNTDLSCSKPNYDQIIDTYNLKKDLWQNIHITISLLSNKDINVAKTISLPVENRLYGTKPVRMMEIQKFKQKLRSALIYDTLGLSANSILYRTIIKHLIEIKSSKATNKQLVIYSDLMENADISFYDKPTFEAIKNDPKKIRALLEEQAIIDDLQGIEIWLIHEPKTYEENSVYMAVANFYKSFFESKGAVVYIDQSFAIRQ